MVSIAYKLLVPLLLLCAGTFAARDVHAESAPEPHLHHAPIAVAVAHESLELSAEIEHPELVKRALLVYRAPEHDALQELEFARSGSAPYLAVIPASEVVPGQISYAIELELADGSRRPIFATRRAPH